MDAVGQHVERLMRLGGNGGIADAIRRKRETILRRVGGAVWDTLKIEHAETLMGRVLDELVVTLEREEEGRWLGLQEVTRVHAHERFKGQHGVGDLVSEYRLLRATVIDELHEGLRSGEFTFPGVQVAAANAAIDLALQYAVAAYVKEDEAALRVRAEAETKYLSYLSHDLRNNMNGILLAIDVLAERLKGMPDVAEDCEALLAGRGAIWETMEGMERLMEAERLKKKAVELRVAPVAVRDAVEAMVANLRRRAKAKGLEMSNEIPGDLVLRMDEQLLRLIVQNLVGNALRYTDEGKVRLLAERNGSGDMALVVEDTGRGISDEEQRRVWEAFRRGASHGETGMGLGLAIVSAAAKLMGAELELQSDVGRGSVFKVVFHGAG